MSEFVMEAIAAEFDRQENCDVQFIVEGKTIGAHRFILRSMKETCPGLHEMAFEWSVGDEPIVIEEMSFDHFKALLRYIYTEEILISNENVFIFLAAAIQFKMGHLEGTCADYIDDDITTDNVVMYMNEAVNFKSEALRVMCQELFSERTTKISRCDVFLTVSQPALSAFLEVDCIDELEIQLFQDVRKWATKKCIEEGLAVNGTNLRQVIGDGLYKIRFPTMTAQDFANFVTTIKGLLTDSEIGQVFQKIMVFDSQNVECPFPEKFRCEFNRHNTPFEDMTNLCNEKVLYNTNSKENCELLSMLEHVKDLPGSGKVVLSSFRLILQCCADLANSSGRYHRATAANQGIRNELYDEFSAWQETAHTKTIQDIMMKYMEIRTKLNKLYAW